VRREHFQARLHEEVDIVVRAVVALCPVVGDAENAVLKLMAIYHRRAAGVAEPVGLEHRVSNLRAGYAEVRAEARLQHLHDLEVAAGTPSS
jgi:hypothetical protein